MLLSTTMVTMEKERLKFFQGVGVAEDAVLCEESVGVLTAYAARE